MTNVLKIEEVFNGLSVPSITYVAQENGVPEKLLKQGILESGTLCLLTGSSKTGKTTLYKHVVESLNRVPLIIRCDSTLSSQEFWKKPLESLDFSRLSSNDNSISKENSVEGKITGTIGWSWLAGLTGESSLATKTEKSESEVKEKILSQPSSDHLIPLLKHSNAILVVEDFHYLQDQVKKEIFQQWKAFSDQQVSVLVVGTTHHGVDLAYANPDLIGRIQQINLGRWSTDDLKKIINQGFGKAQLALEPALVSLIANESSGLPIITQQVCAQLFYDKDSIRYTVGTSISFTETDCFAALNRIASIKYQQFESWYSRLSVGPRKNARKFNTYEILLSVFALDPLQFNLHRHEIDSRIIKLKLNNNEVPPAASINSTLSALDKFQKSNGFELLEWNQRDQIIYVLEPAFLFFIRWRKPRTKLPTFTDFIYELIRNVATQNKSFSTKIITSSIKSKQTS